MSLNKIPAQVAIVTINSETVLEKSGVKNGKEWKIREQEAVFETEDRKQPIRLPLGNNDAHKIGRYYFNPMRNLNVSQFGSIQFKRVLELTPVEAK